MAVGICFRKQRQEKQEGNSMISLQTNVDSLVAQQNLNTDNQFQSTTIGQLTSGYRINKSGDDAAGLAIANGLTSSIAELTQGVNNANNGVSQLQIVDGGLSNISTILNRLKTLATESASSTFTGSRSTLNDEYASLVSEVTRQATNINLQAGGTFNQQLNVFVGGGNDTVNSSISVDLSGTQNAVDATSLGLSATNVLNGGVSFGVSGTSTNTVRLDAPGALFLASTGSESFTFNLPGGTNVTANVAGTASGITESNLLSQLNTTLSSYGITASLNGTGNLQFSGATAFNVTDNATSPVLVSTTAKTADNNSNYIVQGTTAYTALTNATENLTIQAGASTISVAIGPNTPLASALTQINAATSKYGIYAIENTANTGIEFQSSNSFSVDSDQAGQTLPSANEIGATAPSANSGTTNNATAAIAAIDSAIQTLGLVQGRVGAGENLLGYANSLAQAQISGFSAAESQIRDANVAAQAANLTKSQVLTQTAVAALAQANAEPQAVLKLLQG
jgi:flagellin